jgi:hypothetical protein
MNLRMNKKLRLIKIMIRKNLLLYSFDFDILGNNRDDYFKL